MLVALKSRLRNVLPAPMFLVLHGAWHRLARTPHVRRARAFVAAAGPTVRPGPFAGMRYVTIGSGSGLVPKLIGSYELELHEELERLARVDYRRVVNVGCGEGYYAVGLARRLPQATVVACDSAPSARALCARLAAANDVRDRIEIIGTIDASRLDALCGPRTLLVMDCEGCEVDLIDPAAVPSLASTDLLVEIHDFARPGAGDLLRTRLTATHDVQTIPTRPRSPEDFPLLEVLPPGERAAAVEEGRPGPMAWLIARTRALVT